MSPELEAYLAAAEKKPPLLLMVRAAVGALEEIERGEWSFSGDNLTRATETVNAMMDRASEALACLSELAEGRRR